MFFLKNSVYVIVSASHNGSLDEAKQLIEAAKNCGADAINFNISDFSEADIYALKSFANEIIIDCIITPTDNDSVDFLERIGANIYKLSSCNLTNYPLLIKVASKKKPIILSSAISSMEEIEFAISAIKSICNHQIILLHSVGNYPSSEEYCNMKAITSLIEKFNICVGWSDHTNNDVTAIMAVALGAKIIKKQLYLHTKENLTQYINNIRLAEKALGDGIKKIMPSEAELTKTEKTSLIASKDINIGEIFSLDNIIAKKPANGISPMKIFELLGKTAKNKILSNTQISYDMVG